MGPPFPSIHGDRSRPDPPADSITGVLDWLPSLALDIFTEFGFHMILATPLKMLQVLEDYVGGIALVTSPDQRRSYASEISIDGPRTTPARTDPTHTDPTHTDPTRTAAGAGEHPAEADENGLFGDQQDQWALFGDET